MIPSDKHEKRRIANRRYYLRSYHLRRKSKSLKSKREIRLALLNNLKRANAIGAAKLKQRRSDRDRFFDEKLVPVIQDAKSIGLLTQKSLVSYFVVIGFTTMTGQTWTLNRLKNCFRFQRWRLKAKSKRGRIFEKGFG